MVKHMIIWDLRPELSDSEKAEIRKKAKEGLEGLQGKIPGLLSIRVEINGLPSSKGDMLLDSSFESYEALKAYSVHPAHVAVADSAVRPYTCHRSCYDFETD